MRKRFEKVESERKKMIEGKEKDGKTNLFVSITFPNKAKDSLKLGKFLCINF